MAASWIKRVWDKPVEWDDTETTSDAADHWYRDPYLGAPTSTSTSGSSGSSTVEDLRKLEEKLRELTSLNEVEVLRANLKELQKENKELKEFIEKWAIGETDE